MKTSEMIAMLENNKNLTGELMHENNRHIMFINVFGQLKVCKINNKIHREPINFIPNTDEWKLVKPEPKEVTFLEAMEAYKNGKTIKSKEEFEHTYKLKGLHSPIEDENYVGITPFEILECKWFVEESKW